MDLVLSQLDLASSMIALRRLGRSADGASGWAPVRVFSSAAPARADMGLETRFTSCDSCTGMSVAVLLGGRLPGAAPGRGHVLVLGCHYLGVAACRALHTNIGIDAMVLGVLRMGMHGRTEVTYDAVLDAQRLLAGR